MLKATAILVFCTILFGACGSGSNNRTANSAPTATANNQNASAEKSGSGAGSTAGTNQAEKKDSPDQASANADCRKVKVAGKEVDEKQTFAFDYEPFKGACFVTLHDPEFDDPALGSEFFIFKDGGQVINSRAPLTA